MQLTEDERNASYFQQDSTIAHTTRSSMREMTSVFRNHLISRSLWPPCSSDMTPCDFFIYGTL
ncbi:hypothetical protein C0J52_06457 [Blattella germanica]|nr:hypothetical protein C0J52_06457 [Blattella germanica]